jgi:hypothetical protein
MGRRYDPPMPSGDASRVARRLFEAYGDADGGADLWMVEAHPAYSEEFRS